MATPKIYNLIKLKISRFHWWLCLISVIFFIAGAVILFSSLASHPAAHNKNHIFAFLLCEYAGCTFWLLGMISSYQEDPLIWKIPIVGNVYKALVPKSTIWGEAMYINLVVLMHILFSFVLLKFLSGES
jgi:hypothetical protein